MPTSASDRSLTPSTVWLARGRHTGTAPGEVLRGHLQRIKEDGGIDDFRELAQDDRPEGQQVFEARWRVPEEVTVRARLELAEEADREQAREWTLIAEAEAPWNRRWPSPATRFWPEDPWDIDGQWDHTRIPGLRFREVNALPPDDKELRRVLRAALREEWAVHLVVHEAMTPDARGREPLLRFLPPSLRDRVVEHRAAPHQLRAVNWALKDAGIELPRGGAVVLPAGGLEPDGHSVRTVFLDGTEPTELVDMVIEFAAEPRQLPEGAADFLASLRDDWHLLTLEEELVRERQLVAMYADALDAMTKSRDLYREAADRAHEALEVYREQVASLPVDTTSEPSALRPVPSPLQGLTRTFERFKGAGWGRPKPRELTGTSDAAKSPGADGTSGAPESADAPDAPKSPGASSTSDAPKSPEKQGE